MKFIPTIDQYMTAVPHSIGYDQTLEKARTSMKKFKLRHLPVLKGGKLIGILTDRDLKYILQFNDIDPRQVTVEEAATAEPYSISPKTRIDEVVARMADKKYGCALVVDRDKLVGIFTDVDVCRVLANLLKLNLEH